MSPAVHATGNNAPKIIPALSPLMPPPMPTKTKQPANGPRTANTGNRIMQVRLRLSAPVEKVTSGGHEKAGTGSDQSAKQIVLRCVTVTVHLIDDWEFSALSP